MRKGKSLLPTTVVDQLRLWEMEKHRIQTAEGQFRHLITTFVC